MTVIQVPYHLDEHLPGLELPGAGEPGTLAVTAELPEGDRWTRMAALYAVVAEAVEREVRAGAAPVVVSGDCTASLGTAAGLRRAGVDASVVWFDAHGDVQTQETTASGYLGGMPLRVLLGYRPGAIADRLGLAALPEERALLVGARDLDPPEAAYLAASRVGRRAVAELTAADLPDGPLLLHLDVDVIDAAELPGLRYPAPGGPSTEQVLAAVARVAATGRVAAVDLACPWHPGAAPAPGVRARLLAAAAVAG
ncbi:arginase family protein [Allonocardiopsis opalescens]|uniref:Arginase n=1 Tax=Allonocardiopsis opalescens TaxID=1144618 RepID=A0A2T0Q4T4_9ACTN|nr:arginase family protein [Allonocardiopsis opalescens]PRX98816.1 arginase [Allonocardiopsis opalescens]